MCPYYNSVITNKPETFAKQICEGLGILKHLDICIGGRNAFPHKPDKLSAEYIINNYAEERTPILVGDSLVDMETARNACIMFCFASYGYENSHIKKQITSDFTIKKFTEINNL